ncbi:MAG TPA: hypothetical protein VMT85_12950 [Thermoanaerobaculia bacterium]|nr:hypothetical protein [Thermoanaerobaculia bacterium]
MASLKGTYVSATVKALSAHRERALQELPKDLHPYLHRRILKSKWYPAHEHFALLRALVKVVEIDSPDPYAALGAIAAERDMRSTYKVFLIEGNPASTFERLCSVWSLGHDDGEMRSKLDGPDAGSLELSGHEFCPPELCRLHSAFFARTLEMAGATGVEHSHTRCRAEGDETCRWRYRWSWQPATGQSPV